MDEKRAIKKRKKRTKRVVVCPSCKGDKEEIKSQDAANQLFGLSIGFRRGKSLERYENLVKRAYGPCSTCGGTGVVIR